MRKNIGRTEAGGCAARRDRREPQVKGRVCSLRDCGFAARILHHVHYGGVLGCARVVSRAPILYLVSRTRFLRPFFSENRHGPRVGSCAHSFSSRIFSLRDFFRDRFFQRSCQSFNNHPLLQSVTRQRAERENSPKRGLLASHLVRKRSRCCPAFRSEVRQDSRLHLFNAVLLSIFTDKDQKSHCLLPSARFSLLVNPSPHPSFRQPEESPRAHSLTPISITNCVDRTQEVSGDRV